ncbi:MAG: hypothetical protein ACFCVA_10010 [Gammaproteobacteria bacterium]
MYGGKHLVTASVEYEHMFTRQWGGAVFVDAGEPLVDIATIAATRLRLTNDGFTVDSLVMHSDRGRLELAGDYLPARNFEMDLTHL